MIVAYDSSDALERSLPPLVAQLREGDELIVVDNTSSDGSPSPSAGLRPRRG